MPDTDTTDTGPTDTNPTDTALKMTRETTTELERPEESRARYRLRRTWLDLVYLCGSLLTSIIAFGVLVTGVSVTATLAVFIVGFFVFIGTAWVFRWTVEMDRRLATLVRGEPIPAVYRTPASSSWLDRLRCTAGDPQTWKDVGWMALHSLIGFGFGLGAIIVTSTWIGIILMPTWWWAVPNGDLVNSWPTAFAAMAIGLALTPLLVVILRGMSLGLSSLAAVLLGPSERQRLNSRVQELTTSRAGAVEASQEQLEQIERDLHDGAQARIVSVAMELGMAEQEVDRDPEAAREPIKRAREGALEALQELRSLARGIRPALLTERGLEVAVDALIERSALPASLRISGPIEDTPEKVETAAYFVVAEALTNAIKHSGASRVRVSLARTPESLRVTITDEGVGGADEAGSGLAGMRKRVRALDGDLEVSSPDGGPTVVAAELPCPTVPAQ